MLAPHAFRWIAPLILAAAFASCAHTGQAADGRAGDRVIRGRVVEAGTNVPIVAAQVFFVGTAIGNVTDSTGTYELASISPANIGRLIAANYIGYVTQEIRWAGEERVDFSLEASPVPLNGVIVHGPSALEALTDRPPLAFLGGRMFDAIEGRLLPNPGILVVAGRIAALGPLTDDELDGAEVHELGDEHVVLPGLIDLHAHYAVDLLGEGRVDELQVNPMLFIANGVTSTFPAGEMDPESVEAAARRWNEVDCCTDPYPRLLRSGPYFGSWRPGWDDEAMTADSIAAEVDHWAARGVVGFKAKGIRADHLKALIERAHAHGLTVTGHLGSGYRGTVNTADAIRMGIDRIEHFLGGATTPPERSAYASLAEFDDYDGPELREIIDLFLRRNVYFDATLSTYGYWGPHDPEMTAYWTDEERFLTPYTRWLQDRRSPRPVVEQFARVSEVKRRTVKAFYDAGGRDLITMGTDHPSWGDYFSGFGAHREMLALVRAGIPEADVLRIATINGARALGFGDRLGSIEAGKWADLAIVSGNPLEDIRNARNVVWVVVRGQLFDVQEHLQWVEDSLGPFSEEDHDYWRPAALDPVR